MVSSCICGCSWLDGTPSYCFLVCVNGACVLTESVKIGQWESIPESARYTETTFCIKWALAFSRPFSPSLFSFFFPPLSILFVSSATIWTHGIGYIGAQIVLVFWEPIRENEIGRILCCPFWETVEELLEKDLMLAIQLTRKGVALRLSSYVTTKLGQYIIQVSVTWQFVPVFLVFYFQSAPEKKALKGT